MLCSRTANNTSNKLHEQSRRLVYDDSKNSFSDLLLDPNVALLYPLKTSENPRFSDVFSGYRSGTLVENGLSFPLNDYSSDYETFLKKKTNKCTMDVNTFSTNVPISPENITKPSVF